MIFVNLISQHLGHRNSYSGEMYVWGVGVVDLQIYFYISEIAGDCCECSLRGRLVTLQIMISTRGKAAYISPTCGVGRGEKELEGILVQHATTNAPFKDIYVLKTKII